MRYLRDYLQRTNESLENYIKIVKESEPRLWSCYVETVGFSSDEFVKIILVDSAFIIEVLLRFSIPEFQDEHERIFSKPCTFQDVWPDLCLLENELPFFILEELYKPDKITLPFGYTEKLLIIKLSHKFFTTLMHLEGTEEKLEKISPNNVAHFVDFLRNLYIPSNPHGGGRCKILSAHSMAELHHAGVKFRVGSSKNLFDIHFNKGILEIPRLTINGETELALRNLIAFEQCHCMDNYLNDYIVNIDCLANTPKDVDLLVEDGIVENRLGDSSEGATLINKVADGVIMDPYNFYFDDICDKVNALCRSFRYRLKATWLSWKKNLKENYFNTPWAVISIIAATSPSSHHYTSRLFYYLG